MRNGTLNLHIDKQKALFAIVFFVLITALVTIVIVISTNSHFAQLNSLWHSEYKYSAIAEKPIGQDDYFQYNAGISFAYSPDSQFSINTDIVMQTGMSDYTNMVHWNANSLSSFGIAITNSIARSSKLSVGDALYSKHIVSGIMCEYTIEQILPEVNRLRVTEQTNLADGIIVMGYDELYADSISHSTIFFSREPFEKLSEEHSVSPTGIIYRDDEITSVISKIIPFLVAMTLFSIATSFIMAAFITKNVSHNFRRLITLGYDKKMLNVSYNRYLIGIGGFSSLTASIICLLVAFAMSSCKTVLSLPVIFMVMQTAILWVASIRLKSRLWRS